MRFVSLSMAALVAAGALGAVTAAQAGSGKPTLLVQDQKKAVTVTGMAIDTTGQPAAKLPVTVAFAKPMEAGSVGRGGAGEPDLLAAGLQDDDARWKTLGKGVTDQSGRFSIKNIRETGTLRVSIGAKNRSDWKLQTFENDGTKDTIDLGEIKLEPQLSREEQQQQKQGNRGSGRGGR